MVTMPGGTSAITNATRRRSRTQPLSWHLLMLCLTLVLPILVLAGVLASYVASQHAYLDRTGLDAARGAAQAIDRELTGLIFAAEVLAQAPSAQAGNWPEFASYAREFRRELRADIEVHDRAGQQRVNTADAEGATPTARPEGAT